MIRTKSLVWASILTLLASPCQSASNLTSKRGLAYHGDKHKSDNELLTSKSSEIAWYYTWSTWPSGEIGASIPFVPLIHGLEDASDNELVSRLNNLPESSTHLLLFNEPDGEKNTGGSSISPKDAAESYLKYIVPLRDDEKRKWKISHPSVTGSDRGFEWLSEFNKSCYKIDKTNGCPTDFVAVHWYGDAVGLQNWLARLEDFYDEKTRGGRQDVKYWVTEVAVPKESQGATLQMMENSTKFMDDSDSVEAYAWFGAFRTDEANEWTGDSVAFFDGHGKLTELGAKYLGGEERGFKEGMSVGASWGPSWSVMVMVMSLALAIMC